jgi:hypothetical protein
MKTEEGFMIKIAEIRVKLRKLLINHLGRGTSLLELGDTVLLWDKGREKPGKHGKFDSLWLGPYVIREIVGPNSFHLNHLDGDPINISRNGQQLKLFFR